MPERPSMPESWVSASLTDICEILDHKRVPVNNRERNRRIAGRLDADLYPYFGATGQVGVIDDFIFEGEHILLGEDGAPFLEPLKDQAYLVQGRFWVNNHAHILRSMISNKYVYHYLNTVDYSSYVTGTTRLKLTKNALATIPIHFPSLAEQQRIVAKIEGLFSELEKGIESLKKARAQLATYRQAVLKHAFEGKLTAQWRDKNKDSLETRKQLLACIKRNRAARSEQQLAEWRLSTEDWEKGERTGKKPVRPRIPKPVPAAAEEEMVSMKAIPSGWLWLTAESVGMVQLGRQRSPKNRSKNYPTKYIRAANIKEYGLDLNDVLDMDFRPHELSVYRLEKDDLLLSEASGSASQVGKPAIWRDQIPNCCFQNTVIRHQPYCRDFAAYLLWLYRFYYASGTFAQVAGGVGINHLSAFKFAQIMLPVCSLSEQQEIVRRLEERFVAIEQEEREVDTALKQAYVLRQAILNKAFSGQLVPQDPSDESASVLLDRIRAEREQLTKRGMRRMDRMQMLAKAMA